MDFGIISLGNHAVSRVIPAIRDTGSRITHVYSTDRSKGERISKELGAEYSSELGVFLKKSFEAVYISSPNYLHFLHAKMSFESGKSVLLEKPATLKVQDTETLSGLSKREGLRFAVGFHLRFHPAIGEVKRSISSGLIGEPRFAFGKWTRNSSQYNTTIWRGKPEMAGGGSVVGIGVHVFDSFVNLFGKEVESVKAFNFPKCSVVEDTMHSTFDFRNGVIATSLSSRLISSDSNDLVIFGNEGSITLTNFYSTTVSSKLFVNNKLLGEFDGKVDMYAEEVKDFVGRCEKIAGPEEALLSTKMHLYSQESACTGKSIPV